MVSWKLPTLNINTSVGFTLEPLKKGLPFLRQARATHIYIYRL